MNSVLHIWDQAGVSCVLAKYQRKLGVKSRVIKRTKFDNFGIMKFYKEKLYSTFLGKQFQRVAINEAKNFDILHVHDLFEFLPILKKKFPEKKIILHYHGTKLRTTPKQKRMVFEKNADRILVSTPDLISFVDGIYLPNPIDIEHFSFREIDSNNLALGFTTSRENRELFNKILSEHKIKVDLQSVNRGENPIMYESMPKFLSKFEYYLDIKWIYENSPAPALSMTGLQALSLGLKVINYEYKIISSLPQIHHPEKVTNQLKEIYDSI
jgi:hypothetical protein